MLKKVTAPNGIKTENTYNEYGQIETIKETIESNNYTSQ